MKKLTLLKAWSTPSLSPIQEISPSSRFLISNEGAPVAGALTRMSVDQRGVISADTLGDGHSRRSALIGLLREQA
jgi:hypothetical protein